MIDTTLFKENLLVSTAALSRDSFLKPGHKNYFWSRIQHNVFGVVGIRPRAGQFEMPWSSTNCFPVPDLEQQFNKSLSDIIDQRAIEIFNYARSKNKKITIMWSGGIDSTCIVSAFIKNLSKSDLENIIICATVGSVRENPYFYETQIRGQIQMLHLYELAIDNNFLNNSLLIHGDPGDCIMGPSVSKYKILLNSNKHLLEWKNNRAILYHLYYDQQAPEFAGWWVDKVCENLDLLQSQGKFCNVKTICDWHWWIYYNLKWHDGTTRALICNKKNIKEKISRSNLKEYFDYCFFASCDFQIWSYQHLHELVTSDVSCHKKYFKNYIYDLDSNDYYLTQKLKVPSAMIGYRPLIIDLDGVHHNYQDPGMPELVRTVFECQ